MAPEQDWCLECGNAATTRVLPPPSWRLPAAIVVLALALLGGIVALTVGLVSEDAQEAAGDRAAATTPDRTTTAPARRRAAGPAPRPGAAPTATTPARTTATTPASTVPGAAEAAGRGPVPVWPRTREAYTVVIVTTDRAGAAQRARELIRKGEDAGILRTDGYDFFSPGSWVAWAGEFPDKPRAQAAAQRLSRDYPGAYATLVRRSG